MYAGGVILMQRAMKTRVGRNHCCDQNEEGEETGEERFRQQWPSQ